MADISKIKTPDGTSYDIKDTTSRSGLSDKMDKTNPTGTGSFSLNRKANTTIGTKSFAEGLNTTASGNYSHAEGRDTTASSGDSHAEGFATTASGAGSHAECRGTTASGVGSHAEGVSTTASGEGSHAEGRGTKASSAYQHVFGKYNIEDTADTYAEIVGKGSSRTPSNARTLDWSGNEVLSGTIEATGFGTTLDKEVDRGGVQLTQAQYDALVSAGTVDANTTYFITDANNTTASYAAGVTYDNTSSGLSATNVQDAIDEVKKGLGKILSATLTAGSTSLTFNDASILADSMLAVYTSPEIFYNSLTASVGMVVLTFDAQAANVGVKLEVR